MKRMIAILCILVLALATAGSCMAEAAEKISAVDIPVNEALK